MTFRAQGFGFSGGTRRPSLAAGRAAPGDAKRLQSSLNSPFTPKSLPFFKDFYKETLNGPP